MAQNTTGPGQPTMILQETETLRFVAPCVVGFIILIGLVGNIIIILSFLAARDNRKPPNAKPPCLLHWIVQNVAACDLGLLFLVCPIFATEFARESWIFGPAMCSLMRPLDFAAQIVAFYSVCSVAVDTCFAVADPLGYEQKRNSRVVRSVIFGIWAVAIALSLPVWVFSRLQPIAEGGEICTVEWPIRFPISFQMYGLIFVLGLPLLTTFICIIAIFVNTNGKLWRPADNIKKTKEMVNLMVALSITGFMLCAPSHIIPLPMGVASGQPLLLRSSYSTYFTVNCFVFAFSCIKPMLYIFTNTDICNMVVDLIPSCTGSNIKRNGFKYKNRSPRHSSAKAGRGQHYKDHRYPDTPVSTRSFPGSRSRVESRANLRNVLTLQFTEDGWARKTL